MTPKDCAHWLAPCVLTGALVGIGGGLLRWAGVQKNSEGALVFDVIEPPNMDYVALRDLHELRERIP
jgi:hypothetical protein